MNVTAITSTTAVPAIETELDSFADLIQSFAGMDAPMPESSKNQNVVAMSVEDVNKIVPELTMGLLQADGTPWPGSTAFTDDEEVVDANGEGTGRGQFGPLGATYVIRPFVPTPPSLAKFVLDNLGGANRNSTKSRIDAYTNAMKNDDWSFVYNTAIFTIPTAGQLSPLGQEQHNAAHTMKSAVAANRTVLLNYCFGVPKSERDKIDDNQQRSAKDIVTTRSEMRTMFAENTYIGGTVMIDKKLSEAMMRNVSESFRIFDDIRNGKDAKSTGNRNKTEVGQKMDQCSTLLGKCVANIVAVDSRLECDKVNAKKEVKHHTSGGLTKRIQVSHATAALVLSAGYTALDGTLKYDEKAGLKILRLLAELGNEKLTDVRNPMVSLQKKLDFWNQNAMHKGSSGMNVRFVALKTAILFAQAGIKIDDQAIWDRITATSGRDKHFGGIYKNADAVSGYVGLDDYVDPTDKIGEAKSGDAIESQIAEDV